MTGSQQRRVAERVAVVTGASSGVGRAVALALAVDGAAVHAVARDGDRLQALVEEAAGRGGDVTAHPLDLAGPGASEQLAAAVGSVDLLVHCAGVIALGPFEATTDDELRRQWIVNVEVPFAVTRGLLPTLRRSGGDVVFVNSTAGRRANAGAVAYATTKGALRSMADGLREEVNADGIRVLTVYLGRTATPMQAEIHSHEGRHYRPDDLVQPDDVAELIVGAVSLTRSAELTELSVRPARKPSP
jgi:NADP-dependent 3-hydroxy acid dehydrogenase YdfG